MKIPKPISEAEYERRLARLVERMVEACETALVHRRLDPNGVGGKIYRALLASPEPLIASAAVTQAGLTLEANRIGVALANLELYGWIQRAGTCRKSWRATFGITSRDVILWRALPESNLPRVDTRPSRIAILMRQVDMLDARRAAGQCLAPRVLAGLEQKRSRKHFRARNAEIVRRRLEGQELQVIALDYGITRERVRQIFESTAFPAPKRPMGRPRKIRRPELLWTADLTGLWIEN